MPDPVSGAPAPSPDPSPAPAPDPTPAPAPLNVDPAEWNRIQAENRRLKKAAKDREETDARKKAEEDAAAAKAAGDFDRALGVKDDENERLRQQLQQRDARDAVVAEAAARGLNAEQGRALARLTDIAGVETDDLGEVRADQVASAVDATLQAYPNMFQAAPAPGTPGDPPPARPRRGTVPGTPPREPAKPEGFVTMEEYIATPQEVRLSPEFQKRVQKSRPYWPKIVPAKSFASDPG